MQKALIIDDSTGFRGEIVRMLRARNGYQERYERYGFLALFPYVLITGDKPPAHTIGNVTNITGD